MSGRKIHILNFNTYEVVLEDGEPFVVLADDFGRHDPPEGMIWHVVLGKFVPKSWQNKKMWVDESEVFKDEE